MALRQLLLSISSFVCHVVAGVKLEDKAVLSSKKKASNVIYRQLPHADEVHIICEIKKGSGSSAYIINENQKMPLNDNGIKYIRQRAIDSSSPSRIKLNGLSRAQISRIATDLQEENPGKVVVSRVLGKYGATQVSALPKYEIVML